MSALYAGSPGQRTRRDGAAGGAAGGGHAGRLRHASAEGKTRRSEVVQLEPPGAARAAAAAEAARTCAICLDSVDLRDVKFDVRCGHKFHPACLQEYIAKYDAGEVVLDSTHPGAVCPVCRERLIVDLAPPWRTWFAPRPEAV